ncbi:3-deoxy-manno-octulosonate-8-phosphatase KdsC [Candidatus Albibeggiatoa sp. nov. NOAA]|uniref:3-deoxy-manno-octulosonate-8-phosphatase KdsC n=1 Tax=Candidatus Albibeggiatoa sp. nov. NOAA TaxID=3162724 RepID=UPI0033029ECC|nr:3-deoxy-manno-octulosonate-8-phosphatase KdsC [Thiotrichaceae bacterium]
MEDIIAKAASIRLVIFDVDGVLTDGGIFIGDNGEEYKSFFSRDGLGMVMLQKTGVKIGIITGRTSQVVLHRMQSLGIEHIFQGQSDKIPAFQQLCKDLDIDPEHVAYVGDDIVDLPVMRQVGLAISVGDAHPLVVKHSHWQTHSNGGRGAAREVCELIMEAQDTLSGQLARYGL